MTLEALQARSAGRAAAAKRRRKRVEGTSDGLGALVGRIEPRLWTPPLRKLTPRTSVGFDQVEYATSVLRRPPDPWQEWLWIHAGELLPDGRPRFRIVLVIVARQNGKTENPAILTTYWQFVDRMPMIMGTSTKIEYAKETWQKSIKLVERTRELDRLRPRRWKRETNGEQETWTAPMHPDGTVCLGMDCAKCPGSEVSRHKIAASNDEGGRSLTINRLYVDELRQHKTYAAWDAAEPATNAVWDAQIWCLSNAGDDTSVVLNNLRDTAVHYLATGEGDERLGIFEWSAEPEADPTDVDALAQANPNLGRRINADDLLAKARRAVATGGAALTGFKTESMCIRVASMAPAIDPAMWRAASDPGTLDRVRDRMAMVVDVSPDGQHASLVAAAVLPDQRVRVEVVHAWAGPTATADMRRDLAGWVARVRPKRLGWLPNGPAAAVAAVLKPDPDRPGRSRALPREVELVEIRADVPAVCMGFAEQVKSAAIAHSDDPLLSGQVLAAGRRALGDLWIFERNAQDDNPPHCDAAYAAAGAVHLVRTLPHSLGKPRVIVAA